MSASHDQAGLMSSWCCDDRHAEFDRRDAGQPLGLLPFLPEEGEGEVDALDLTEPSLVLGAGAAGQTDMSDLWVECLGTRTRCPDHR